MESVRELGICWIICTIYIDRYTHDLANGRVFLTGLSSFVEIVLSFFFILKLYSSALTHLVEGFMDLLSCL